MGRHVASPPTTVVYSSVAFKTLLAGLLTAGLGLAQNWVIGGGLGYGGYRNATINSSSGAADAGIRNAAVQSPVGEIWYVVPGASPRMGDVLVQLGGHASGHVVPEATRTHERFD